MKEDTERTPLRTILTNFLNHIDTLENQRTPDNTYESEFQELKQFSESIKGTKQYSCSEGEKEVNKKKNRYKDILPFDLSRVVLNDYAGIPGSDYINANYIKGASGSPAYIASQGPLPNTVNDFWRMVVQCEVQVIVMACNQEEAGKHKCENYWAESEGEEKQFGMVSLRLIKASTVCPDFSVRTMRLKYTNNRSNTEERTVCQFHYWAWPDHGVPPLVKPLLDMVRLVRDTQASETLPVLIHCSAGCGRTGTICAIDYVWGLLRAGKLTKDFSLLVLVREMRRQRIAMVQTKEQYVLVHRAVRELFREQLRMIDSHPYENIDCNGLPLIKCPSPEPTYDTVKPQTNDKSEEKQDEKEKEVAPPLPQKKRMQTLSSKQAKEEENLSERQRLVSRAGEGEGPRPCIATLRSVFERDSRQVARSHSLGSVRPTQQPTRGPVENKEPMEPVRGVLKAAQRPALPVKRSKSLRVLGSSDPLTVPSQPPPDPPARRLSLESNIDETDVLSDFLAVDSVSASLGVRERRNSFRQAVRHQSQDSLAKKPGLLRSYTSVDMRSAREKPNLARDAPAKPVLRPKPNLVQPKNASKILSSDPRLQFLDPPQRNQQFSALSELKKSQFQGGTSRALTSHSMSLRIAARPKREDCRALLSPRATTSQQADLVYSSGESTKSASSDQGPSYGKSYSSGQRSSSKSQHVKLDSDIGDSDSKAKQIAHFMSQRSTFGSRGGENLNMPPRKEAVFHSSGSRDPSLVKSQETFHQTPPGRPEKTGLYVLQRNKSSGDLKSSRTHPDLRPVIYDSKGFRSEIYGSVQMAQPPPYVEPGKTAQKPRSSPHSFVDKQTVPPGYSDELYGKIHDQRHWQKAGSSRDMVLPQNPTVTGTGTDVRLNQLNVVDSNGSKYPVKPPERMPTEQNYKPSGPDVYSKKAVDRRYEVQSVRREAKMSLSNDRRLQEHERRAIEQEHQRQEQERRVLEKEHQRHKNSAERRRAEQSYRPGVLEYSKFYSDKGSEQNTNFPPEVYSSVPERADQDSKSQLEPYYRSRVAQEPYTDADRRRTESEVRSSPQEAFSRAERETRGASKEQLPSSAERRPASGYAQSGDRSCAVEANIRRQDPRAYLTRNSRTPRPLPNETSSASATNKPETTAALGSGVRMRRGSRDDLALVGTTPSRVKRHASVVVLRHSLIEGAAAAADPTLTIWAQNNTGAEQPTNQSTPVKEDPWSGSVGVDLDRVAASITTKKDGKMMRAALEALHLRKATPKQTSGQHKTPQAAPRATQPPEPGPSTPYQPPAQDPKKAGPFRKQQQYL